jgi:hypothetical protein
MGVMGDQLPEAWMAEWHRNGRVEFPLRRWSLVQLPVVPLLAFAALTAHQMPQLLDDRVWRYAAWSVIAAYVGIGIVIVWQLVTQRPYLVVDRRGIHRGTRFLAWNDISSISFVTGPAFGRQLPIEPKDVWAKNLVLTQRHVHDLPAFRLWLGKLLDECREA